MNNRLLWNVLRIAITTAFLFLVWLALTGDFGSFSLGAGAIGSLLIALATYRVFLADHDASLRLFLPSPTGLIRFLVRLALVTLQSSVSVALVCLGGKPKPRIVFFRTRLHADLARMTLANAISLSPGTTTLDLDEDHLTVYWFLAETRHSRAAGEAIKGSLEGDLQKVWR